MDDGDVHDRNRVKVNSSGTSSSESHSDSHGNGPFNDLTPFKTTEILKQGNIPP